MPKKSYHSVLPIVYYIYLFLLSISESEIKTGEGDMFLKINNLLF